MVGVSITETFVCFAKVVPAVGEIASVLTVTAFVRPETTGLHGVVTVR